MAISASGRDQQAHAQSDALDDAWEHWLQYAGLEPLQLPESEQPSSVIEQTLPATTSSELKRVAEVLQLDWNNLLAAAVVEQCRELGGDGLIALSVQGTRPAAERLPVDAPIAVADLEPARILGPLDLAVPYFLQTEGDSLLQRVQALVAQMRAYPQHGVDYGALRYLSDNTYLQEPLRAICRRQRSPFAGWVTSTAIAKHTASSPRSKRRTRRQRRPVR
ncbi:hypothetical protein QZH47_09600 [Pseudomonas corrugata]